MRRSWLAAALLAASACAGSEESSPSGLVLVYFDSTNVEVPFGATVAVEGLSITFTSVVEDSRCPVDVTCIWEGNGRVGLRIEQGETTLPFTLNTAVEPRTREFGRHRIRVVSLDPAPRSDRHTPPGEYRVLLTVTPPAGTSVNR